MNTTTEREIPEESELPFCDVRERDGWIDTYRRVVEFFEQAEAGNVFEKRRPRYPMYDEPYVLEHTVRMPAHADDEKDRPWHILFNPWSGGERTCWIMDGQPVLPSQTVHGADDPEEDVIANDRDLVDVYPGRVVVTIALTKVAGIHAGEATWIPSDDRIEAQIDRVLDALDPADYERPPTVRMENPR